MAKASEVLGGRWTLLVLREMLDGSARFNDIRRGVPLMSSSLLSARLRQLERSGVVERLAANGRGAEYRLTDAGSELRPLIDLLAVWGDRWAQREIAGGDLDPALLMWDVRRRIRARLLPPGRTVIEFRFTGVASARRVWWLVCDDGRVDLCLKHPGYDVDLFVASHVRTMVEVWLGRVPLAAALRDARIRLDGARPLARTFVTWFGPAPPPPAYEATT